ncbi:hypothetical protein Drorol1_Dr00011132 [Drosera rotundifolia]
MTSTTSLTSAHLSLSPSSPLSNTLRHRHKTLLLLAPNSHPRQRQRRPLLKVSYFSQVPSLRLSSRHSNVREWTLKCSGSGSTESEKVEVGASGVAGGEEKVKEEESQRVFEKLLTAEKERVEKQEEVERQAYVQLERQLVVASEWSRALLQWQGKLKGTEWDPEDSHRIDYIDFVKLLDSKNVKFMEYSDYGQAVSVILPYYKEKTKGIEAKEDSAREIIYKRHVVDRMPVDGWNETWKKLHQQVVNVDMLNASPIPGEVYSTVAVTVVWSMRLALAIVMFLCIDHFTRPIYTKVIRFKKEKVKPLPEKEIEPIKLKTDPRLGSMGKSRAKFIAAEERTGVTFDEFGGQDYVKKELQEIVEMLKNEEEYQKMGIYCPKGVLLHGPPGTGKTLLAKAIAGESGLPFFATNGTDFVEMFSGVAASRVKDLFDNARSYAPSVIFIDEIDAIGCERGGPDIGKGGAEREKGLLQLLTEMDGFQVRTNQVLVIGATNRMDILDPALLRKGRFDKILRVGLPSKEGRVAILKVHARNKSFRSEEEKEAIIQEIAEQTEGFTGAELMNILNEAGILTTRSDQEYITIKELQEAIKRQKGFFETGQEDSISTSEDLKLRIAYREAAVAVLACCFPVPYRPFVETNITPVKRASNMSYTSTSGKVFHKKADFVNAIVRAVAPRVIEEDIFGVDNISWVTANVPTKALQIARRFILTTGMTALGKAYYRNAGDIVPSLEAKIQALEVEYIRFALEKCSSLLKEHHFALETMKDKLLEKGKLKADEIWDIYDKSSRIPQPAVTPVDEYSALLYAGRWGIYGVSLPGRVTFNPGYVGFATFGAPRPMETQALSDHIKKAVVGIRDERLQEIRNEASQIFEEEEKEKPDLLLTRHFL